jgi:hypothetical protein
LRAASADVLEVQKPHGAIFYFRDCGPLVSLDDGEIDTARSPVVNVFKPQTRRGLLWTAGEVHFLTTPLQKVAPGLQKVSRQLKGWFQNHQVVCEHGECTKPEWAYLLEGSVKSHNGSIYALPTGLAALNVGQYFVAEGDSDPRLDKLCKSLRLRGIECTP